MPYIRVNPDKLYQATEDLDRVTHNLSSIESSFSSAMAKLNWEVKNKNNINQRLRQVDNNINSEKNAVSKMADFMERSYHRYCEVANQEPKEREKNKAGKNPFNSDSSSVSTIRSRILDLLHHIGEMLDETFEDINEAISKIGDLIGSGANYLNKFINYWTGDKKGMTGAADWIDLTAASSSLYKALVRIWSKGSEVFKENVGGFLSTLSDSLTFGASIIRSNADGKISMGEFDDIFDNFVDLGRTIYVFYKGAKAYSVRVVCTLPKLAMNIFTTSYESTERAMADGHYSFDDLLKTLVDVPVSGLNTITSNLTYDIISVETLLDKTPEQVSVDLQNWAINKGHDLRVKKERMKFEMRVWAIQNAIKFTNWMSNRNLGSAIPCTVNGLSSGSAGGHIF